MAASSFEPFFLLLTRRKMTPACPNCDGTAGRSDGCQDGRFVESRAKRGSITAAVP